MAKEHICPIGVNGGAVIALATTADESNRCRSPGKRSMTKSQILVVLFSAALAFCHAVEIVSAKVIDAETGGECIDSDPVNCPFWAATGECKKNRGYMHKHCRKSCDRCNVVRVNDRNEIGRYIKERQKEMEARRDEKRKEKETLKVLEGSSFGNADVAIEKNARMDLKADHDNKLATATISSTGTVESTVSATNNKELNKNEEATESSTNKLDSATATATTQPSQQKPATSTSTTNEKPKRKKTKTDAQTGLECVDFHENCPFWAATGDCKTNRSFMSVNCRLSCDRCQYVSIFFFFCRYQVIYFLLILHWSPKQTLFYNDFLFLFFLPFLFPVLFGSKTRTK